MTSLAHPPVDVLTLSAEEIERLIDPKAALDALAEGFKALSRGDVQAPPRPMVSVPGKGFSMAMLAWAPGQRIALKCVSVFHDNHAKGLPSHAATVSLFDPETGLPVAVLDGAVITGLRTAASAALTVRALARPEARIATVIGAGVQGREHLRVLPLVGKFEEIRVYSRSRKSAEAIAAGLPRVRVVDDAEAAVRSSDVVCLCTSSEAPVIEADWVRPGTHVTSVGYVGAGGEVPRALIDRATIYVETRNAFAPTPVGSAELQGLDPSLGIEVGELLAGTRPGRTGAEQVTLYKSMGNAMEDMVVANIVYDAALRSGRGRKAVL